MKNKDLIEIEISKVVNGGYGLGRVNNFVYFVPFSYPGDVVLVKPIMKQKNCAWAEIKEIIKKSPFREEKACPQMGICGGCMWGMLKYEKQIEFKKQLLEENLKQILDNREKVNIEIYYEEKYKFHYRTRVKFHSDCKNVGFYKFHTRQVIDVSHCVLIHKKVEKIRRTLLQSNIKKNIYITVNPDNDEYLLYPPEIYNHINKKELKNNHKDYFLYENIPIVNGSFAQNSLLLNKILKQHVHELIKHDSKILDLYCGSGNFTIDLDRDKSITGIDIDSRAIKKACEFSPFQYIVGDENIMAQYLHHDNWDVILLDPPRQGAKYLVPYFKDVKTKRIIYISCEPVTLTRDVKELSQQGWEIQKIIGIDMFPHTPHIESIIVLSR